MRSAVVVQQLVMLSRGGNVGKMPESNDFGEEATPEAECYI